MNCIRRNYLKAFARYYSEGAGGTKSSIQKPIPAVAGLSSAVVHPASTPVGPNVAPDKSGAYKVPEYYCYNNTSFFEAEIEMSKFRLPQPSSLKK